MTHITCRLTAKIRDQLRNHTLGNRVWASFTFYPYWDTDCASENKHQSVLIPTFVFVRHKIFLGRLFCAPRLLGAAVPLCHLSHAIVSAPFTLVSRSSTIPRSYGPRESTTGACVVLRSARPLWDWIVNFLSRVAARPLASAQARRSLAPSTPSLARNLGRDEKTRDGNRDANSSRVRPYTGSHT